MLKIWGRVNSINVQKAMWCLGELGLDHERIDAGMAFGKNNEDWFLKLNPNGLVPVIDDDGFILWESNAIVRYLAAKYGLGSLCPQDPQARADGDRWMDWQVSALHPPLTVVLWNLVRTPPDKRDMSVIQKGVDDSSKVLRLLDHRLANRDFVTGSEFTMGDIPVGTGVYRWFAFDLESRPDLPNLRAYYERLCQREAYRQHVMIPLS